MFHRKMFIRKPQDTNVIASSLYRTIDNFLVLSKAKGKVLGPINTQVDESLSIYILSNSL